MSARLERGCKAGSDLHRLRSEAKGSENLPAVCNSTGGNYWNAYCIYYLRHETKRSNFVNAIVPASFESFCYNGIAAGLFSFERMFYTRDNVSDEATLSLEPLNMPLCFPRA